jgi:energy-coupling factor transport system ATP-binding protein
MLLLDEPTANLDPAGVIEVRDAVSAALARTGATLIVVEHRVSVWKDLVDRVVVLAADGGVLADGPPDAVLADRTAELRRAGVWLPGQRGVRIPAVGAGEALLTAEALRFSRSRPLGRRHSRRGRGDVPMLPPRIDLRIREGSALALTGRNGAGKSTLALTLGGLLPVAGGTLRAEPALRAKAALRDVRPVRPARDARPVGAEPALWRSQELVTRIGSVFQNPEHQFVAATVRDELAAGPRAIGEPDAVVRDRVGELLERLALEGLADANPFTLSGGQKRRLSVATALATRPCVLLLDEPTFGQDANTWAALVAMIGELRADGHAIVTATHDAEFVRAVDAEELVLGTATGAGVSR